MAGALANFTHHEEAVPLLADGWVARRSPQRYYPDAPKLLNHSLFSFSAQASKSTLGLLSREPCAAHCLMSLLT